MPLYRDDALVLRAQKLGEADRIITLLTREHGKVRAVGKGVRRTGSKFGARLEPFMHIDIQLNEGRTFDMVTQVDTIGAYAKEICADYGRYTAASAIVETADRLTVAEREPAVQQFWLAAGALRALSLGHYPAELVLDSYLLRSFAVAGYAPSFDVCAQCGAPGPHTSYAVASGGAVCGACRPPGAASPAPQTFAHMAALLSGDWPIVLASPERSQREASGLIAAFTQYHLERTIRALRLVERP
ncbi:DNA repair protein RecO [Jonesia quinghaiensis]|uniref:DNA repair protein RecO n=1 Tax=Jonesia quinghaiensis TaxID=262806 RepID=UPI00040C3266|nr:DNA repair protein RecO [Jonesia quinghaiensis]